jgi:hypothetical protein
MQRSILLVLALLAAVELSGCLADYQDSASKCVVQSFSNNWQSNGVREDVQQPYCPVTVGSPGEVHSFASYVYAPTAMPAGNILADFYDANASYRSSIGGFGWGYSSSTEQRNYVAGGYAAALLWDSYYPNLQDYAITGFPVTAAYSPPTQAAGLVLLPYHLSPPVSPTPQGRQATVSRLPTTNNPIHGVPTIERIVPQINEAIYPVTRFDWYFDGVTVLDSAQSYGFNRISPGRVFTAKVPQPGTHTWRVVMTYGSWPASYTSAVTWTQTWR